MVDEPLEELRVVHDLVVAAELGVLVGEGVEAVRALGDDLLHAHRVEGLDVLGCEHLEQVLVAGAAGGIAGAGLGRAEDGEVDVGALHELRHRLGDLLVFVVERAGAADPVEVLGLERIAAVNDLDALHTLRPVGALTLRHAPRVGRVLHRPVGLAEFGREVGIHERQVATHVEDLVEDLDVDRANFVTGLTRCA